MTSLLRGKPSGWTYRRKVVVGPELCYTMLNQRCSSLFSFARVSRLRWSDGGEFHQRLRTGGKSRERNEGRPAVEVCTRSLLWYHVEDTLRVPVGCFPFGRIPDSVGSTPSFLRKTRICAISRSGIAMYPPPYY